MIVPLLALLFAPPSISGFDTIAKQAAAAREANRIGDSIALYRRAVSMRPRWAEGWWYVGTLLYDQDQYGEAIPPLKKFLSLTPKSQPGQLMLGLCEYRVRDYEPALRDLSAGLSGVSENNPVARVARYHHALLLIHFGEFQAALGELRYFANHHEESVGVVQAVGTAGLRMAVLPEEITPEQKALAIGTGTAVFDSWSGKAPEAAAKYKELVAAHPNNAGLHYLYGSFLLRNEPDSGLAELEESVRIEPGYSDALLQIAFEYLKRFEAARALAYAERAVQISSSSALAHHALGRALVATGEMDRGLRELELAVQLDPEQPEARFALADAYTKAGRKEDSAKQNAEFLRLKSLRDSKREDAAR